MYQLPIYNVAHDESIINFKNNSLKNKQNSSIITSNTITSEYGLCSQEKSSQYFNNRHISYNIQKSSNKNEDNINTKQRAHSDYIHSNVLYSWQSYLNDSELFNTTNKHSSAPPLVTNIKSYNTLKTDSNILFNTQHTTIRNTTDFTVTPKSRVSENDHDLLIQFSKKSGKPKTCVEMCVDSLRSAGDLDSSLFENISKDSIPNQFIFKSNQKHYHKSSHQDSEINTPIEFQNSEIFVNQSRSLENKNKHFYDKKSISCNSNTKNDSKHFKLTSVSSIVKKISEINIDDQLASTPLLQIPKTPASSFYSDSVYDSGKSFSTPNMLFLGKTENTFENQKELEIFGEEISNRISSFEKNISRNDILKHKFGNDKSSLKEIIQYNKDLEKQKTDSFSYQYMYQFPKKDNTENELSIKSPINKKNIFMKLAKKLPSVSRNIKFNHSLHFRKENKMDEPFYPNRYYESRTSLQETFNINNSVRSYLNNKAQIPLDVNDGKYAFLKGKITKNTSPYLYGAKRMTNNENFKPNNDKLFNTNHSSYSTIFSDKTNKNYNANTLNFHNTRKHISDNSFVKKSYNNSSYTQFIDTVNINGYSQIEQFNNDYKTDYNSNDLSSWLLSIKDKYQENDTLETSKDKENGVNSEKFLSKQLEKLQKTPSKHQLKHWMKIPSIKESSNKEIKNSPINDSENEFTIVSKNKELLKTPKISNISSYEHDSILLPSEMATSTSIKNKKAIKDDILIYNNNNNNNNNNNGNDNISDTENLEDLDLIQEILPDLHFNAQRLINLLFSDISSIIYTKEETADYLKICKKKIFFLETLKLTMSQFTKTHYIDVSHFLNYLSNIQIHSLVFANAALLLSHLYNPFFVSSTLEDLNQRYTSLYEINQKFSSIFNITFSQAYKQIIELRTQLFIHVVWLNQISKDQKEEIQFNEDTELKKYFLDKSEQYENGEKNGDAYLNMFTQRMQKIQHIRQSSMVFENLINEFPWHHFVNLMTEFIQRNILSISDKIHVADKSSTRSYQGKKISNLISSSSQFSMDYRNNGKNHSSKQNEEQILNSENEGEIPASDIRQLSQIVLGIENNDNTEQDSENNNKNPKYQKILQESQDENSQSIKNSLSQNTLEDSISFTQEEVNYNNKKRKYEKKNKLSIISTEIGNSQDIENPRNILKTDTLFFNASPDISSNSSPSNSLSSSPPSLPSASAQVAMELYKKSLAIQGLSSTLISNKDIMETSNDPEEVEYKSSIDPYKDYSIVRQHLRLNKARRKEFKPQHRVPWSETEINCLMKAIKEYGSQWSFILSLYGPNGTLSRDLAERGQVQLKDKARNIKEEYIRAQWKLPPGFETVTCKYD
ncbi:hypothetical protein PCANB_002253 [Pneumocystis canis]|nr:hypothetical protein PCANB_002253 [Pneumocystis canis]